jgi:hypothetical protein
METHEGKAHIIDASTNWTAKPRTAQLDVAALWTFSRVLMIKYIQGQGRVRRSRTRTVCS